MAQLTPKAQAACGTARSKQSALAKPADFRTNANAAAAYLTKLMDLVNTEIQALPLNVPKNISTTYVKFYAGILREHLFLDLSATLAKQRYYNAYARDYNYVLNEHRTVVVPAASQLGFTGCAGPTL